MVRTSYSPRGKVLFFPDPIFKQKYIDTHYKWQRSKANSNDETNITATLKITDGNDVTVNTEKNVDFTNTGTVSTDIITAKGITKSSSDCRSSNACDIFPRELALPSPYCYERNSPFYNVMRQIFLLGVGFFAKTFNSTSINFNVHNSQRLQKIVLDRLDENDTPPLITVSNHSSTVDDVLVMSALLPFSVFADANRFRWCLCAEEICFKNDLCSYLARLGKGVPIRRGAGLWQPGIAEAVFHLNKGAWLHVYPQGHCVDGIGPLRWGVGKLVVDSDNATVLPFVHRGMNLVLPPGNLIPNFGHTVDVLVGQPMSFCDLIDAHKKAHGKHSLETDMLLYRQITDEIEKEMHTLNDELSVIINERSS